MDILSYFEAHLVGARYYQTNATSESMSARNNGIKTKNIAGFIAFTDNGTIPVVVLNLFSYLDKANVASKQK